MADSLVTTAFDAGTGVARLTFNRPKALNAINVPLDVRAKGKRNPEQKWFSSSQFDEFMLGTAMHHKSKSPGLAENTWALVPCAFT